MNLLNNQCIVIKIGSALLIDEDKNHVNQTWLTALIEDIAMLHKQGIKIVLVSSGAVAYGKLIMGLASQHFSLDQKQAAAAVGQIGLMHTYQQLFNQHEIKTAQVLLTLEDTEQRHRYINLRNTLHHLLKLNIVPIINENDSVATAEIRYGDNDRLSARTAQMLGADTLVLLSDIDGFYTDDPNKNKHAKLIPTITNLDEKLLNMAKDSSTQHGSGGMITKLQAAKIVMQSGCHMLIIQGKTLHPITHYLNTQQGSWFKASITPMRAKKQWLAQHLKPQGCVIIDEGAANALHKGASLLPIGLLTVEGEFKKGDAVKVCLQTGVEVARGLINYHYHDTQKLIKQKSDKIATLLGYDGCHEIIHSNNLIMLRKNDAN